MESLKQSGGDPEIEIENEDEPGGLSYSRIVWKQFRKNRPALAGLLAIGLLALVAILADVLAGDKPYYMNYKGKVYYPVLRQYGVYLGLTDWPKELK